MDPTITLNVTSLAYGGDGVARAEDGRTVFVAGGCPGDVVLAEVTADHERFLRARVAEVVEASPERRKPPCPYFGDCGGCQWQHVSHGAQVAAKRQAVADALSRIGGVPDPDVRDVLIGGQPYGYRNRVELAVGEDARGGLVLGLSAAGSQRLVPIAACMLLPEKRRTYPKALAGALRFLSRGGPLGLTRVAVRSAARTGDVEVDLWAHPGPFPRAAAAKTLGSAVRFETLTRVIAKGEVKARDVSNVEVLAGQGYLRERMNDFEYRVSAPSFFQVNTGAAVALRTCAIDMLGADGAMRVADLYAGAGTFTLPLARAAGEVVAVESSRFALADLRENLAAADLDADVVPGDAAYALPDLGHFDAALIDPPRAGISEKAMRALEGARIPRIVYVSCDPATLARDVARLADAGYAATRFVPVDLFPQTYHLETVALLEL